MEASIESLGDRLKRLRKSKFISVKELSDKIGVPLTTYREWEHGRKIVGEPYIELSRALEVSVYELITGEKNSASDLLKSVEAIENEIKKVKENLLSI